MWLESPPAASASGFQLPPLQTTTPTCVGFFRDVLPRRVVLSIEDFGGVGDGKTSKTESFRRAIWYMQRFQNRGGAQLNIPTKTWLTGSFNLTSNFTLFLHHGVVIIASQDKMGQWMVKEGCGGNFGETEHWSTREGTFLN